MQKTQAYFEKHNVKDLFSGLIERLVVARPAEPVDYLINALCFPLVPKIVAIGPPGAGTSRIAHLVCKHYDVVLVSAGQLIRDEIASGSASGLMAAQQIEAGRLVPDVIVIPLVLNRITAEDCKYRGFMIEGFPRTLNQADALMTAGHYPNIFMSMEVPDSLLLAEVTNRRFDPLTKTVYHIVNQPPADFAVQRRMVLRQQDSEVYLNRRLKLFLSARDEMYVRFKDVLQRFDCSASCGSVSARSNAANLKLEDSQVPGVAAAVKHILSVITKVVPPRAEPPRKVVVFGPPGSGKTSVCRGFAKSLGMVHISVDDILLAEYYAGTPVGIRMKELWNAKDWHIPDEICIDVVKHIFATNDNCKSRGWLLEGFPRTNEQAQWLKAQNLWPDIVISLEAPEQILSPRLQGRRVDPVTNQMYHVQFDPPDDFIVVKRMIQTVTDSEEQVTARINLFFSETHAILNDHFTGVLHRVDASKTREVIYNQARNIIFPVAAAKRVPNARVAMRVAVLGPPCSGRTTQCDLIASRYGVVHVNPADLIENAATYNMPTLALGEVVRGFQTKNMAVPEEVVQSLVVHRLKQADCQHNGFVLNGYPRETSQATNLTAEQLVPERVILLDLPATESAERAYDRRIDPVTKRSYNIRAYPPKDFAILRRLVSADHDSEAAVFARLEKYQESSTALIAHYGEAVTKVDASQEKKTILEAIKTALV